jgi:hypothetical protein
MNVILLFRICYFCVAAGATINTSDIYICVHINEQLQGLNSFINLTLTPTDTDAALISDTPIAYCSTLVCSYNNFTCKQIVSLALCAYTCSINDPCTRKKYSINWRIVSFVAQLLWHIVIFTLLAIWNRRIVQPTDKCFISDSYLRCFYYTYVRSGDCCFDGGTGNPGTPHACTNSCDILYTLGKLGMITITFLPVIYFRLYHQMCYTTDDYDSNQFVLDFMITENIICTVIIICLWFVYETNRCYKSDERRKDQQYAIRVTQLRTIQLCPI